MIGSVNNIPRIQTLFLLFLILSTSLGVFIISYYNTQPNYVISQANSVQILTQTTFSLPTSHVPTRIPTAPTGNHRYLSYQPPGNGWNNQRIAFEHAVVFSRLLNRTLLAPPMAPHLPGRRYSGQAPGDPNIGYRVYNELTADQLIPMDSIIDFQQLSQLIQVQASTGSHVDFLDRNSGVSWRRVCHSPGYGFWMDRRSRSEGEREMLSGQKFHVMSDWLNKCGEEKERLARGYKRPFIRFLLDELYNATEEIIYFEEGTLFGIEFRFIERENAILAQHWLAEYVRYHQQIAEVADEVVQYLRKEYSGGYNSVHVRRNDRYSKYGAEFWLNRVMTEFNIPTLLPLYVSTDEVNLTFFDVFREAGYTLVFRQNLKSLFTLVDTGESRKDIEGMSEQIVCARAEAFVPSIQSTFTTLILRMRNEVPEKDGVFTNGYYFVWAEHFKK